MTTPEEIARLRNLLDAHALTGIEARDHLRIALDHIEVQGSRIAELERQNSVLQDAAAKLSESAAKMERELEPLREGTHWMAPTEYPGHAGEQQEWSRLRRYLAEQVKEGLTK